MNLNDLIMTFQFNDEYATMLNNMSDYNKKEIKKSLDVIQKQFVSINDKIEQTFALNEITKSKNYKPMTEVINSIMYLKNFFLK